MEEKLSMIQLVLGIFLCLISLKVALLSRPESKTGTGPDQKLVLSALTFIFAITLLGLQYLQKNKLALRAKQDAESSLGIALWAYTEDHKDLRNLRDVTDKHYFFGYRLFKNGDWDAAARMLNRSVELGEYEAPSRYILAYMLTHHPKTKELVPNKDWDEAYDQLKKAVAYDRQYSPAWYLRAKMEASEGKKGRALKDLKKALADGKFRKAMCVNILDRKELKAYWGLVAGEEAFALSQTHCEDDFLELRRQKE